ncbi:MAG: efflux RND transporter periplasmic adaptor subunit [Planctomycetes bacterium]|nr:efflux RND transporter periplasmic adaptor subunit [Planctomycetota bacterium]
MNANTHRIAQPLWAMLSALVILGGCGRPPATEAPPPPEVTVARPIRKDIVTYDEFTGRTAAIESVEVRARVRGFLQSIKFKESAEVKKGDLLFVIDPSEFEAQRDKAKAQLASCEAELVKAQMDLDRAKYSAKQGVASKQDLTDSTAARDMAKAAVKSAQAALREAELQLGYTQIHSPIDGRAGRAIVTVGNLVGASENTLLTTVVKMNPIYVYFDVSENLLLRALEKRPMRERRDPDQIAFLGLSHQKDFPFKGELDYIDNTVDPTTGTIEVRGLFPNDKEKLFPGLFARVRVPWETVKNAVLVKECAIGSDLGGKYVLTVNDKNVVEHRPVEVGSQVGDMRVIKSGLRPEERYIVEGLQRARPGLPVTPKTMPAEAPPEGGEKGAKG